MKFEDEIKLFLTNHCKSYYTSDIGLEELSLSQAAVRPRWGCPAHGPEAACGPGWL